MAEIGLCSEQIVSAKWYKFVCKTARLVYMYVKFHFVTLVLSFFNFVLIKFWRLFYLLFLFIYYYCCFNENTQEYDRNKSCSI